MKKIQEEKKSQEEQQHQEDELVSSRRSFMKGAALGTIGAAVTLSLPGCGGGGSTTPDGGTTIVDAGAVEDAGVVDAGAADAGVCPPTTTTHINGISSYRTEWLGTAPSIDAGQITETITVDVLILGGGHSGIMAAISAVDAGAKVAVIESSAAVTAGDGKYVSRYGEDIGHVNSKWLLARGYGPFDTGEVVAEFVKRAAGRLNQDLVRTFVENSGAMFDKMCDIYGSYATLRKSRFGAVELSYTGADMVAFTETHDLSNMLDPALCFNQIQLGKTATTDYPISVGGYKTWPTNAMFQGPVRHQPLMPFISCLKYFECFMDQYTQDKGVAWYYKHQAVVLTQASTGGKVTGAIVLDKATNTYKKFVASKGVLVSTGDFAGSNAAILGLLNDVLETNERLGNDLTKLGGFSTRTGDGHRMCLWAGGQMEALPRGSMGLDYGATGPWGSTPMLQLNANGERFANESTGPTIGASVMRQPIGKLALVTDANYMQSITVAGLEHGGPNFAKGTEWTDDFFADMDKVLAAGSAGYSVRCITVAERQTTTVYGANDLATLAGYLGYTGDAATTFVKSIEAYNALCAKGVDADYGKDPKTLIPINKAPYYGVSGNNGGTVAVGLVSVAGVNADKRQRVLDGAGNIIEGLYVAGNTMGGRYGPSYSTPFAGNSIGFALTHGWMAGKYITGAA